MKQTVRLLAILMAVFCSSSVYAQVVDPMSVMEITPAQGVVTSLQHFTITFADLPVVVDDTAIPTLEKGGGATCSGHMRAGEDGKSVVVDFDEEFTLSGIYFLHLPGPSIYVNGQALLPLALRFSIEGTIESFYDQITIDPAEGVVESLGDFIVSLPQYVTELSGTRKATLTNTTTGASYSTRMNDVGFEVLIYFSDEVTEPGEYVLTIPAGIISIYTLGEEVHELNFHYTIAGAVLRGDVNGDGFVNISDVTALIDILLSGTAGPEAADVNADDAVNISDVTALIDMLLSAA